MAVLCKTEIIELPATRMIGIKVVNGGGNNPVPELWEKCFKEKTFDVLDTSVVISLMVMSSTNPMN